ncbi:HAD-IC family P-type ATPase [Rappaport israeli]|uniref:HAD-IC family P-type ATPase n=1 Tax=Rappaport israeli TaxID=1839807 RepID=UPI0009305DBB|nr:HAD-IC family P-type ATPase [Rappaport israeli]
MTTPYAPTSPTLLQSLSPYTLHIASGDRQQTVKHIATQLNIPNHRAQLSPEDKLHYLESLKSPTLMIGDGINDAPVLAAAHVSIAVGKANPPKPNPRRHRPPKPKPTRHTLPPTP